MYNDEKTNDQNTGEHQAGQSSNMVHANMRTDCEIITRIMRSNSKCDTSGLLIIETFKESQVTSQMLLNRNSYFSG